MVRRAFLDPSGEGMEPFMPPAPVAPHNEIQVGRYNRMAQKFFQIKGGDVLNTVAPEIMPVLSLFHGAENRYLEGWDRFGIRVQSASVAGQTSSLRLRNPTGSNVIAVVEKITVLVSTVGDFTQLSIGVAAELAGAAVTGNRFDSRGRGSAVLGVSNGNNIALVSPILQIAIPNNVTSVDMLVTDIQEICLLPGDALTLTSTATTVLLTGSFWWRERFLEESERT